MDKLGHPTDYGRGTVRGTAVSRSRRVLALAALCLALGPLALAACGGSDDEGSASGEEQSDGALSRTELVDKVKPSLVAIAAEPPGQTVSIAKGGLHSHGSGVVYDASKGLVLTSNHLVEDAGSLKVTVGDREVQGRQVARAQCNDLAIVRLRPKPPGLVEIPIGRSSELKPGQEIVALGYLRPPGSPRPDLITTDGDVSSVNVQGSVHPDLPSLPSLILTQAPLRTQMSGGPLVNDEGELVGLATLIDTGQGGPTTQAPFSAVSSDHIRKLLDQLEPGEGAAFGGWENEHKCHQAMAKIAQDVYVSHGGPAPKKGGSKHSGGH